MNTFYLKVICSDKVFYEGKCQNLVLPMEDGLFSVLAHHENMVVAVAAGELHVKTPEGEWITAAVSPGFAEIINNRVSVLVNSAERPEEIDVKRAEEARQRAQERLRHKQSIQEYYHTQASLARAMNRLKLSQNRRWNL